MTEPYLPTVYMRFREAFPDLTDAVDAVGASADAAGPLTERSRRLIKLGLAIGAGASGAVKSNARKALAAGGSVEEIMQVVAMSVSTVGMSRAVAAHQWCLEVIESG